MLVSDNHCLVATKLLPRFPECITIQVRLDLAVAKMNRRDSRRSQNSNDFELGLLYELGLL